MGGPELPSLGFAMGIERLLMVMENTGAEFPECKKPDIYIATMGEAAGIEATKLCTTLRNEGFSAVTDVAGRSVKAQMKYADKIGANFSVVLGDDELNNKKCVLKNMLNGEQKEVSLPDGLVEAIYDFRIDELIDNVPEQF